MAMLACARLGAIHSVVFGGFAAHELAVRIDDARPRSSSRPRAGSRARASSPTSRCSTRRSTRPSHAPEHCVILQRPQLAAELTAGRDLDWAELVGARRARGVRAGARDRPALHPLHVGHDRAPEGRRARQRRARRRARVEHAQRLRRRTPARSSGRPPTSAGSSATPTSSTRRCSCGATTVLYEGKPVGTPDAGAFWRVIEQHGVAALFTAPTAIRAIRKEDPEAALLGDRDAAVAAHALPGRASAPIPTPTTGRAACSSRPVIDHWWQTETGWAMAASCRGLDPPPVKSGLAEPARARLPHRRPRRRRRSVADRRAGRDRRAPAAAAGRAAHALERRRALRGVVPRALSRAGTSRATAGTSTRTATCS